MITLIRKIYGGEISCSTTFNSLMIAPGLQMILNLSTRGPRNLPLRSVRFWPPKRTVLVYEIGLKAAVLVYFGATFGDKNVIFLLPGAVFGFDASASVLCHATHSSESERFDPCLV